MTLFLLIPIFGAPSVLKDALDLKRFRAGVDCSSFLLVNLWTGLGCGQFDREIFVVVFIHVFSSF